MWTGKYKDILNRLVLNPISTRLCYINQREPSRLQWITQPTTSTIQPWHFEKATITVRKNNSDYWEIYSDGISPDSGSIIQQPPSIVFRWQRIGSFEGRGWTGGDIHAHIRRTVSFQLLFPRDKTRKKRKATSPFESFSRELLSSVVSIWEKFREFSFIERGRNKALRELTIPIELSKSSV